MRSNFEKIILDDQEILCPSLKQWNLIFKSGKIDGKQMPLIPMIRSKVLKNSNFPELKSCLTIINDKVLFLELLAIGDDLVRVFVESVMCDNCGERALISATPSVSDLYIGLASKEKVKKRGYRYENLNCKSCKKTYNKRYTIWQKYK